MQPVLYILILIYSMNIFKHKLLEKYPRDSVADPESVIWCLFDPGIRDQVWAKIRSGSGIRIRGEHPGYF
jgi:hypothetical protein